MINQQPIIMPNIPQEYQYLFDTEPVLSNTEAYKPLIPLVYNGYMEIHTDDINKDNWEDYMNAVTAIIEDGIETDFVQNMYVTVIFHNGESCDLYITDLFFNIMFWGMIISIDKPVQPYHLFFDENITRGYIKDYCDTNFLMKYKFIISNFDANNIIHNSIKKMTLIDNFAYFLSNTYSLNDDIRMMNEDPEVYDMLHLNVEDVPLEDVQAFGMSVAKKYVDKIMDSDHCLSNSFRSKEGTNIKQFKEQYINLGTMSNGKGSVFPFAVNNSFINGGVNILPYTFVESASGVYAQIISKNNVGISGHFARILSLNNRDTILHQDPNYVCGSRNFQELYITDDKMLDELTGRYYRLHPDGMEYKITYTNKSLIGKKIYLRSPMTCESKVRGEGICFRCYGDLSYTNCDINVGQVASEILSSLLTQRLLSAKHLMEPRIRKLYWGDEFHKIFEISFTYIIIPEGDMDLKGYSILIDPDEIEYEFEGENEDENLFNENIREFKLRTPSGEEFAISGIDDSGNKANLYINPGFKEIINKKYTNIDSVSDYIEIKLTELEGLDIFSIEMSNDELSKSLNRIKSIINIKESTLIYDRHQLLQEFIRAIKEGGLPVNPVHAEVILSNQIRSNDSILLEPDWSVKDVSYNLVTLDKALMDNPSVTVSLSYQKLKKAFYNPLTFKKTRASSMDLIFMKYPQRFINQRP